MKNNRIPENERHLVKEYYIGHTHIFIYDDCYRNKTPEEIKAQEQKISDTCIRLMENAYLRKQKREEEERSAQETN